MQSLNAARLPTCLPILLCGVLKFMSYVGLNAKVYGSALPLYRSSGMNSERLEKDGGERYGIKRGREWKREIGRIGGDKGRMEERGAKDSGCNSQSYTAR